VARRARRRFARPIRFRLTRPGWLFLGVSLIICAGAVNTQAPLLFLIFGAMMGILHVSAIFARRMIRAADLRRDVPSRVWQNQTVHLGYYLGNRRRRGSLLGLEIREIAPQGVQAAPAYCVHLGPRAVFRAGGRFAARSRGRLRMGLVRLGTTFPFGLVAARRDFPQPADVVVWPARGRLKRRLLHWGAVETSRAAPSPATGGQDEFFGLREYRMGDNPRWIHWKRSALRLLPVVREMARPLPEVLMVVLETFCRDPSPPQERVRERMIRFAGTLIDHALSHGYLVGLVLGRSDRVEFHPPAPGRGQLCTLLDALADVEERVPYRVEETLARVEPASARSAIVVVVSLDPDWQPGGAGKTVPFACRRLVVVGPRHLQEVYEDDPLAAGTPGTPGAVPGSPVPVPQ
jgi:uncharacterized protein (DUF58 family)